MVSQEREISRLWYPGSESVITDESNTGGGGGGGQGIFNFSEKLWTPRRLSWFPPTSPSSHHVCHSSQGENEELGWPQGRTWDVAEVYRVALLQAPPVLSLPCPSYPSWPLWPPCSPCLPRATPAGHPPPSLLCPQRRLPAAHCQVQRIKIASGKTRGSRSNINLRDLACRPRCPFPGSLATNMQLVTAFSPCGHCCNSRTFTCKLQQGAPTHLRAPRAQVWPAHPDC